jgi:hypothetical protein
MVVANNGLVKGIDCLWQGWFGGNSCYSGGFGQC